MRKPRASAGGDMASGDMAGGDMAEANANTVLQRAREVRTSEPATSNAAKERRGSGWRTAQAGTAWRRAHHERIGNAAFGW